jgi:predicted permease
MEIFSITAVNVLIMMAYAVPGFLLVKAKAVKPESISAFSAVLLYVSSPFLTIYSFQKISFNLNSLANMGIVLGLSAIIQVAAIFVMYAFYRKKYDNPSYRVSTVAIAFGNVGFLGVPLLEAMIPEYPEAVAYSAAFIISMNFLAWTLGSAFLTGDKKHMSAKNFLLNPLMLGLVVAIPLYFANVKLTGAVAEGVELLGKMTAPLCMMILGMRFATVKPKELFTDRRIYITTVIKLVIQPLAVFAMVFWLPIDMGIKLTLFILGCCPTATIVQNLAEIHGGEGQKEAANSVLVTTIFSMLTIPLLALMLLI